MPILAPNPFPPWNSVAGQALFFKRLSSGWWMVSLVTRGIVWGFSLSVVNCEGKQAAILPVKKLQSIMDDSHPWQKNRSKLKRDNGEITVSSDRRFKQLFVAVKCDDLEHAYPRGGPGAPSEFRWRIAGSNLLFQRDFFFQKIILFKSSWRKNCFFSVPMYICSVSHCQSNTDRDEHL